MSDQASKLRRAVGVQPGPGTGVLRQGPVSIRPRGDSEVIGAVTLTSIRPSLERSRAAVTTPPWSPATPASVPASTRDAASPPSPPAPRLARAIAVASGKGGVGKTSLAASLSIAIAAHRRITWLVDADLGLGNVDVACGVSPRWTLGDVMLGRCALDDALVDVAPSLQALAAGSGVAGLASMPAGSRERLLRLLGEAESRIEELVVDCGAGVGSTVLGFAAAAQEVLLVATPEPASIVDAYGLLKCLVARRPAARVSLVVNQSESLQEALAVHHRIDAVALGHLGRSLPLAGIVPRDEAMRRAARRRRPVVLDDPSSPAAVAITQLAARLMEGVATDAPRAGAAPAGAPAIAVPAPSAPPAQTDLEAAGFLGRVAGWLARR